MKKVRNIRLAWLAVSAFGALPALLFSKSGNIVLTVIFLAIAAIGAIGQFVYTLTAWRCPHCDRLLPTKHGFWSKFCPYCGERLD
jgi:hypothetical protein